MSTMTYLNIAVRRVDRGVINSADLEQFADFFEKEILGGCFGKQYPNIATDRKSMYAYCEWCGNFDAERITPFARFHPEFQIETIAECNDCDERERILYQGDVMEILPEIRMFPDPHVIKWNYGE